MEEGRYPIRGIDRTLERVKNLYQSMKRERERERRGKGGKKIPEKDGWEKTQTIRWPSNQHTVKREWRR